MLGSTCSMYVWVGIWLQPDAALTGSVLLLVACHLMACPDVGLSLLADAQSLHALLLLLQSPR
jgi:hypothetical protein